VKSTGCLKNNYKHESSESGESNILRRRKLHSKDLRADLSLGSCLSKKLIIHSSAPVVLDCEYEEAKKLDLPHLKVFAVHYHLRATKPTRVIR